jgi:hypothetical protein
VTLPRLRTILVLLLLTGAAAAVRAVDPAAPSDAEKAAETAARAWLVVVDAGRYGESWEAAAAAFRTAMTRDQWTQALERVRRPLGKVLSRKRRSAKYMTEVPNAPKGEYVVIQFGTDLENKPGAVETVTPTKDPDGTWRVSGYFIR